MLLCRSAAGGASWGTRCMIALIFSAAPWLRSGLVACCLATCWNTRSSCAAALAPARLGAAPRDGRNASPFCTGCQACPSLLPARAALRCELAGRGQRLMPSMAAALGTCAAAAGAASCGLELDCGHRPGCRAARGCCRWVCPTPAWEPARCGCRWG